MSDLASIVKIVGALAVKAVLAIVMLGGWVGFPVLIYKVAWGVLLAPLYHNHFFWFLLAVLPVAALSIALLRFLYDLLAGAGFAIGRVADRIEGPTK